MIVESLTSRTLTNRARRSSVFLILMLVAWTALGGGTASSSEFKSYTASIQPSPTGSVVAAGAVQTFEAKLVNLSDPHTLGSANITAPSGFSLLKGPTASVGTADVRGNVLELRKLTLPPNESVTVTFKVAVPCQGGSFQWGVQAKQANTFNGPPGNDFTLLTEADALVTNVVGSCALRFVPKDEKTNTLSGQPTDAGMGQTITSVAAYPDGPPVQVEVIDGQGKRVTSSTASITVALHDDTPAGELDGTLTDQAEDGVASFDDLSIETPGAGYELHATSSGLTDDVSNPFTIWQQVKDCDRPGVCTTTAREGAMQVDMAATGSNSGPSEPPSVLAMSLGVDPVEALNCGDSANHAPSVARVDAFRVEGGKTVTLTIDKAYDQQQANNGVSFYEVCFQRPEAGPGDAYAQPALLPDCNKAEAPCVESKTKTRAGDVILTVLLPPGDPMMR